MTTIRALRVLGISMLGIAVAACDGVGPEDVATVEVAPDSTLLQIGQTVQLRATLKDDQGQVLTESSLQVSWSSSPTSIATVDTLGLVTAVSDGSATVSASIGTARGQAKIVVAGPAPSITGVSPATGTVGTELTIEGTNFRDGAAVSVGGIASDSVDVTAVTTIFAIVPAGITAGTALDVTVTNVDATTVTAAGAFTAVAPDLDYVNSATKPSGQVGSTVILEGSAFGDLQGDGQVLFSDGAGGTIAATIANEDDWTNTFIITTVPSGAETGDVVVVTATGTSNALTFTVTTAATFSPSDLLWVETTAPLPDPISGHAAISVLIEDAMGTETRRVYVTGGAKNDSVPQADVDLGVIEATGDVTAWTNVSNLPAGRAFHAVAAATPFNSRIQGSGALYVIGGIEAKGGQPVSTVYKGTLNDDGTVASWDETTPLMAPLHSTGAVLFRSFLYVAGGATTDNTAVATVYRAAIDTLGNLGPWAELPVLPAPRSYNAFTILGNCVHAVQGESGTVAPDDNTVSATRYKSSVWNRINLRTGDLLNATWTTASEDGLAKSRLKHTGVVAGGNLLLTAGLYAGIGTTGSSEGEFAQIGADCDFGSFALAGGSGAIGQQTNGANLFNHAAIAYVDADGVAHVMVLGGDDVDNPGTKRAQVWFF